MRIIRAVPTVAAVTAAVLVAMVTVAGGTPSAGFERSEVARGAIANDGGTVKVAPGADTVVAAYTIAPGGTTGWHVHPGAAIFVVTAGSVSTYGLDRDPCTPQVLAAGEAYFAPEHAHHPHLFRNVGTSPAKLVATYLSVPKGSPVAHDAPAPGECYGMF
jgi:quercetin dioxygenase-like cupin family protein